MCPLKLHFPSVLAKLLERKRITTTGGKRRTEKKNLETLLSSWFVSQEGERSELLRIVERLDALLDKLKGREKDGVDDARSDHGHA